MEIFDLINLLSSAPEWLKTFIDIFVLVHAVAVMVVNLTPTPHDNEFVESAYEFVEKLAGVTGRAKQLTSRQQAIAEALSK